MKGVHFSNKAHSNLHEAEHLYFKSILMKSSSLVPILPGKNLRSCSNVEHAYAQNSDLLFR